MIKNIIFDIGGILFDDSKVNIDDVLGEDSSEVYKKAFGSTFKDCLLGKMKLSEHISKFEDTSDYEKIKYVLSKENFEVTYPLMKKNFEYICNLKKLGYRLFLLSNVTEDSFEYIKSCINIDQIFDGGIYSYQVKVAKPDERIYFFLMHKYHLNVKETIFFDDNEKNVIAATHCGIRSVLFHNIEDIESGIHVKG